MKLSNSLALLISASLLALTACGTSTIGGGTGAGGDGTGGTGTGGVGTGGEGHTGIGGCPSIEHPGGCAVDADCVAAVHQTDCCGNTVAIGVNVSQLDAFMEVEAVCAAEFPQCGCAAHPTVADDGTTQGSFDTPILARCESGVCKTYNTNGLCQGTPSPVSCTAESCPSGYVCTPDPDPNTCHPSGCGCGAEGWQCTADCGMNGSTCVQGL